MVTIKRPNMASLLDEILFETAGQGPPPSKDFYQFFITQKEVIWRWWKISGRTEFRGTPPGEIKMFHHNFLDNSRFQEQLAVVFGNKILEYTLGLCRGHFDYLERLPDQLLLKILSYMSIQDFGRLSQTSSRFKKICNSEEIWKLTVLGHCDMITEDMEMLAKAMGWKNIFFKFYYKTNMSTWPVLQRKKIKPILHLHEILNTTLNQQDNQSDLRVFINLLLLSFHAC